MTANRLILHLDIEQYGNFNSNKRTLTHIHNFFDSFLRNQRFKRENEGQISRPTKILDEFKRKISVNLQKQKIELKNVQIVNSLE